MFFKRTKRIPDPVLGVLDLGVESIRESAAQDLDGLAPLFSETRHGAGSAPICDVLLTYCEITVAGEVKGSRQTFREIVRDSKASVAIIAREHSVDAYIAGVPILQFGRTNLIMTLKRNDPAFRALLARIFTEMKKGIPLPAAWKLAQPEPQVVLVPELIFSNEIDPVAFG
ncbi:MAG TPA: hypothetical protein VHG72_19690 [Polyangia bacterium]|nr:hypothetical protein [Polyangia bacterium]